MDASRSETELLELIWLACEGAATPEQIDELAAWLEADPQAMRTYVEYMALHADLQWDYDEKMALPVDLPEGAVDQQPPKSVPGAPHRMSRGPSRSPSADGPSGSTGSTRAVPVVGGYLSSGAGRVSWPAMVGAMLLAAMVSGGSTAWWMYSQDAVPAAPVAVAPADPSTVRSFSARLVEATSCRWDMSRSRGARVGEELAPGRSLILLEGIAEIDTSHYGGGGSTRLVLEGPVSLIVTETGLPVLDYGKLSGVVSSNNASGISIHTPMGEVSIVGQGAFGIVGAPGDVTIHSFLGEEIQFEPVHSLESLGNQGSFRVPEGTSLRLVARGGKFEIDRGEANERSFVVNLPAHTSNLPISAAYVEAVRRDKPLAYWRFERLEEGRVKNEMADRWHGVLKGEVGWHDYAGNRAVEFGQAKNPGQFMSDESFGNHLRDSYTLEAWIKPSHFHIGSFLGMVNWSPETPTVSHHGLSLEICGPASPWLKESDLVSLSERELRLPSNHPNAIRFLHRNPPQRRAETGNSCYSPQPYQPRTWQYVVATKQGSQMTLYVNGEKIVEAKEKTPCPDDLYVLIGQNWPLQFLDEARSREFVGELDEVAVYDRALSAEEVASHYRLAHPPEVAEATRAM